MNHEPAFPVSTRVCSDGFLGHQDSASTWQFSGMTLRDYFAAAELQSIPNLSICDMPAAYARIADHCYRMADAMIAERNKDQP
jgi:hypothetical protein